MPHFTRMLSRELADCCVLDGWTAKYSGHAGDFPPARVTLNKPGHASRSLTLTHIMSAKKVQAFCSAAKITAEKLAELRAKYAASLDVTSPEKIRQS